MTSINTNQKTVLYDEHKKLGAKLVPFAGWLMPVSYEGVLAEHSAVRNQCGLFDVSHMGEIRVTGKDAESFLQYMTANDVTKLRNGRGQYSCLLTPESGFVDDIILYRLSEENYLICVNASNSDKDFAWIKKHAGGHSVLVTNESPQWCQLAVQGPNAKQAVGTLLGWKDQQGFEQLPYMGIMTIGLFGKTALLARTGYTGEIGYEIYLPLDITRNTWLALLETNPKTGIVPVGLGARDTLRLEACYLLYGNDMDETVSPLEAGISWAIKFDCGDFIGKTSLEKQKSQGLTRQMMAFTMEENAIPRHGMDAYQGSVKIGTVTSGSVLPTVGGAGGMALLDCRQVKEGDSFEIDIRGKRKLAKITKRPLYSAKVKA